MQRPGHDPEALAAAGGGESLRAEAELPRPDARAPRAQLTASEFESPLREARPRPWRRQQGFRQALSTGRFCECLFELRLIGCVDVLTIRASVERPQLFGEAEAWGASVRVMEVPGFKGSRWSCNRS